jgi:hypothetical protein
MKTTIWPSILAVILTMALAGCGDDDSAADSGTTDTDTGTDTGLPDAGNDAGDTDTGTDTLVCDPGDVSDYTPDWKPSVGLEQGVCTEQQIADYVAACLAATATQADCDTWAADAANTDCYGCAVTPYEEAIQGALSLHSDWGLVQVIDGNKGQCISAFEGDDSENSCGAKYEATKQCAIWACKESCPLDSQATFAEDLAAFNACVSAAWTGACASYAGPWNTCSADLIGQGDPVDQCVWGASEGFDVYAARLITVICG